MPQAKLFAAVAALQAQLPRVGKGETAKVPGKDGKQGYTYRYADLADVSQAILPLLAKHGLAFIAKPTVIDGEFGLDYKLVHSSGECDGGFYLLPSPKSTAPQQVGSAITYARRYCLCSVTGIAPDGDDDDAGAAQSGHWQSAGAAFENASPVRPHAAPNGGGQVSRPAADRPEPPAGEGGESEADEGAQEFAVQAQQARALSDLEAIHKRAREAGKLTAFIRNPSSGGLGKLALYIDWRRKQLADVDKALGELDDAAKGAGIEIGDLEIHVKKVTGVSLEDAAPAQIRQAAKALQERAA